MRLVRPLIAAACLVSSASAAEATPTDAGPSVTVYSSADPAAFDPQAYLGVHSPYYGQQLEVPGFAVVREPRELDLAAGDTEVAITDVAKRIDPSTVGLDDATDAAAFRVRDQRFLFDLVNPEKVLERYVGQAIEVEEPRAGAAPAVVQGTLLATDGQRLVLQTADGVQIVPAGGQVRLGALPGGLVTKPTLRWTIAAAAAGKRHARLSYQTAGVTWRADYRVVLAPDGAHADLGAWVTLLNRAGATWKGAKLKLIAGDVQRVQGQQMQYAITAGSVFRSFDPVGFAEKSFFEYHLYTLPDPTDIVDDSTQQLALFPTATGVAYEKVLVFYGLPEDQSWRWQPNPRTDRDFGVRSNHQVDVYLRFVDSAANHLGMPLPRGKIRIYQRDDADGAIEFLGEDVVDHTPRDETVQARIGKAFDVVGDRTQTEFKLDGSTMSESFRIDLRNAKDEPARVIVKENLYRWVNWQITAKSDDFAKLDARTVQFAVDVPAHGAKSVTYTVRYTW